MEGACGLGAACSLGGTCCLDGTCVGDDNGGYICALDAWGLRGFSSLWFQSDALYRPVNPPARSPS